MNGKVVVLILFLAVMVGSGWAQTATVTGQVHDPSATDQTVNTSVVFTLKGCAGNQPRYNGTALLWPVVKKFWTDSSGNISGSLYRNDQITCGSSTDSNYWEMVVGSAGHGISPPCNVRITATTFDATQPNCINVNPALTIPTDGNTYARIDATNTPFTGNVLTKKLEYIRFADQFDGATTALKTAAAIADLSGGAGLIALPSSMATGDISSGLLDKATVLDLRWTGGPNNAEYTTSSRAGLNLWGRSTSTVANGSSLVTVSQIGTMLDLYSGGNNESGTKANYAAIRSQLFGRTSGQRSVIEGAIVDNAMGDAFGIVGIVDTSGGNPTGIGDEGKIAVRGAVRQHTSVFTATISAVNGNVITYISPSNENRLGDGRFLINTSANVYSTGTATTVTSSATVTEGGGADFESATASGVLDGTTNCSSAACPRFAFALDYDSTGANTANNASSSTNKYVTPITAVAVGGTTLTLRNVWPWSVAGSTFTYKIFKGSTVRSVDPESNQITVSDGTQFAAGNTIELPLDNRFNALAAFLNTSQDVASSGSLGTQGLSLSNGSSTHRGRWDNGIVFGGNMNEILEVSGVTIRPTRFLTYNSGPAPSTWFYFNDNVNDSLHDIFNLTKNSGSWIMRYNKNGDELTLTGQSQLTVTAASGATTALFDVRNGANGQPYFRVNSTSILANNSVDVIGYSGNQSGEKWRITGSSGNFSTSGSVTIGSGTAITKVLSATSAQDIASIAANTCTDSTGITVTGAVDGDVVQVGVLAAVAATAGLQFTGYVSAADTVKVRVCNVTTGAVDPASTTYRVVVTRF